MLSKFDPHHRDRDHRCRQDIDRITSSAPGLNRQLDLERVRVKTENMQQAVDHSAQKGQADFGGEGAGAGAESSEELEVGVSDLLAARDQVRCVWLSISCSIRPTERQALAGLPVFL
jgi:hypothetical protein